MAEAGTYKPDSVEGLAAALRASAEDVAAAFASAQRGSTYYEADHPVVVQQRRDLEAAVRVWQVNANGDVLMGAAGEVLLLTGLDEGVANDSAKVLCASMISRSVVGFRLKSPTPAKEISELVAVLAENAKRVRAAGGVARILAERNVRSVIPTEMDLDALLSGAGVDPAGMGLDPLIGRALSETLALKKRDERKGAAVSLTLERVDNPASLGSLLDELIDGAAPGVADAADPKANSKNQRGAKSATLQGPLAGVNADDLAELCAEAYGKVAKQKQTAEQLTEAARVLSGALVRLSPAARFKLLQKIAATDKEGSAAEAVGREVPNPILMSAMAQVVMGGERDSKLATAIGSLLERMRPLERDRQRLIDELDDTARSMGRPLDALFLQELNETSQKTTFGALDLPFRETREGLAREAKLRQTTRGQPDIVTRTFASLRPENRVTRTARLLVGMLDQERNVAPATLASVRTVLTLTATDPSLSGANAAMIHALWTRALRDGPTSPAAKQLADLASSPSGADWCITLLEQLRSLRGVDTGTLLGDFVKAVLAVHEGETFRRRLVDALHALDRGVLRVVERRIAEFTPMGVQTLIVRAGRDSATAALALAQAALRSANVDVKEAALRALGFFVDDATIGLLRRATGVEGEGASVQALYALKETEANVQRLQRAAVETLGVTKHAAAVPVLVELLTRTKMMGGGDFDRLRTSAARALAVNNTREARAALDDGKRSKNRAVRLACGGNT
jgi:hypothetical protein